MLAADQLNGMGQLSRIDLAHRRSDGIDVVLRWSPEDDSLAVEVLHLATDESFELVVDGDRALAAFYHPPQDRSPRPPRLDWSA